MKNAIVLDGKKIAKEIEKDLQEKVRVLKEKSGKVPALATIIVGNDLASKMYIKMKGNACKRVGINPFEIELDQTITTEELLSIIENLNNDENIDGILLQHPLPSHINERECFDAIKVEKDVDGVTCLGFGKMALKKDTFVSATSLGIVKILEMYNIDVEGKHAVVIGRSAILGKPIAMMLLNKNATVTIAHSKTVNLKKITKTADLIVACVGKAKFVKKDWLKKGVIIIDAGYNEGNIGDVDLDNAISKAKAYTPVPGGVGPMTIACLLQQTLASFESRVKF